jgi:hypothetical protein
MATRQSAVQASITFDYTPPPTCYDFMLSEASMRVIMGPVGSGKTYCCIVEMLRRCMQQAPAPDGNRYTRWAIGRQTQRQLEDTVLKDITMLLGSLCEWQPSKKTILVKFPVDDKATSWVISEWILIPLEDKDDVSRLLSMQLTGAWLSECIEMSLDVVGPLAGRLGRYPSANFGAPSWYGMIADTNFPMEGDAWWTRLERELPPGWRVFKQPGGLEPDAENLEWLTQTEETRKLPLDHPRRIAQGRKYYQDLVANQSPDWVNRYVHARYGIDPSGLAVFRDTYKPKHHLHRDEDGELAEIPYDPTLPLLIGQDFGRNPWAVICQVDHRDRLNVLREVNGSDMALITFLRDKLKPTLSEHFPRTSRDFILLVGDPTGRNRSTLIESNEYKMLADHNFHAVPARTNVIEERLNAVHTVLSDFAHDGPMIRIDAINCPNLVLGFAGQYKFTKRRDGSTPPTPDKNHPYSDVMDALQYAATEYQAGGSDRVTMKLKKMRPQVQAQTKPRPGPRAFFS